ncbi:MAG: hypothetical protein R3E66_18745 [bacterium]
MISILRPVIFETKDEISIRLSNDIISRLIRLGVFALVCGLLAQVVNVNHDLKTIVLISLPVMAIWSELYMFRVVRCGDDLKVIASRFLFLPKRSTIPVADIISVQPTNWIGPSPWISVKSTNQSDRFRLSVPYSFDDSEIHERVSKWIMNQAMMLRSEGSAHTPIGPYYGGVDEVSDEI